MSTFMEQLDILDKDTIIYIVIAIIFFITVVYCYYTISSLKAELVEKTDEFEKYKVELNEKETLVNTVNIENAENKEKIEKMTNVINKQQQYIMSISNNIEKNEEIEVKVPEKEITQQHHVLKNLVPRDEDDYNVGNIVVG